VRISTKPYMRGKVGEAHSRIDLALLIEDRTAEFTKVESDPKKQQKPSALWPTDHAEGEQMLLFA
jgi:hypothetical protein